MRHARKPEDRIADTPTCRKGHPRTPENIKMRGNRIICRPCMRLQARQRRQVEYKKPTKDE